MSTNGLTFVERCERITADIKLLMPWLSSETAFVYAREFARRGAGA